MPVHGGLWLCEGVESLGLLVSSELEKRWADGTATMDSICQYSLVPTGKLFRPILLLDSARAVGGDPISVLPAAAGVECGHVASLIHDDIIDQDEMRRGRPSVQHKYGINEAIIVGDALLFDQFAALAECRRRGVGDRQVASALEAVASAGLDVCRGQSLESELTASRRFDAGTYLRVARLKTSFFRGACESGAILGDGSPEHVRALRAYGENIGTAFQIHDDLLAYLSETQIMGKPTISDVQNGRITLPVIVAHESGSAADKELISAALFADSDPLHALAVLSEVVDRTGGLKAAAQMARDYSQEAKNALTKLPPSPSRQRLACLADAAVSRDC